MKHRTFTLLTALWALLSLAVIPELHAEIFSSQTTLYSNSSALSGWYTGNQYTAVAQHGGDVYFVMLDSARRPWVGKISGDSTDVKPLEKDFPDYVAHDDGHHEFSLGVDRDGYIHVTGDMHNFPGWTQPGLPASFAAGTILYWKSKKPGDVSDFDFMGEDASKRIPGHSWTYGRFVPDRNGRLYYSSRTLAGKNYGGKGGRGLGLYSYDETSKSWTAYGVLAPFADASYPVIAWENSGAAIGGAGGPHVYQMFIGDISFDPNNRMHLTLGMNTQDGIAAINSVIYAYSDDGGLTFKRADGSGITLPMQAATGSRQADVVDIDLSASYGQPGGTYAFGNAPVIHFNVMGESTFYRYWTGSAWSERIDSPAANPPATIDRLRVIFNEHEERLYFINIHNGEVFSKSSFTSSDEIYDVGETFRYFDINTFQKQNILYGVSWHAPTGNFNVFRLNGAMFKYKLTVTSGSGDGDYEKDGSATITADAAPTGKMFDKWTGDIAGVADVNSSPTTLTMPGEDVTVTATYKDSGSVSISDNSMVTAGNNITINSLTANSITLSNIKSGRYEVSIFTPMGRRVVTINKVLRSNSVVNFGKVNLTNSLYIVRVTGVNGTLITKRVVR